MNPEDRDVCLKEISSNVTDCGKTVSISNLSEDWGISMKESSEVLEKWLSENQAENIIKSFLLRGVQTDGSQYMAVISEDKMNNLSTEFKKPSKMLYSIRLEANSNSIQIPKILEAKRKRLVIPKSSLARDNCEDFQDIEIKPIPASSVTKNDKTAPLQEKSMKKNESNSIASMFKNTKVEPKTPVREQKASNTKEASVKKSPIKKSPSKTSNCDSEKQKGIASFFNSKTNGNTKNKALKIEVKVEKTEEHEMHAKKPEQTSNSSRKRSSFGSDESDETTAVATNPTNPPKRQKMLNGKKPRSKGSRILQMSDSSDDEVGEEQSKGEVGEEQSKEESSPKPAFEKVQDENKPAQSKNNRNKRRRIVTRTYEDEDGFIKTVKESEEYSTSEAEEVTVVKIETEQDKKKKVSPVKVSKPKAATKQGSIMSFFAKK